MGMWVAKSLFNREKCKVSRDRDLANCTVKRSPLSQPSSGKECILELPPIVAKVTTWFKTLTQDSKITVIHNYRVKVVFVVFSRIERGHKTTFTTARKNVSCGLWLKRAIERRRKTPVLQSLKIFSRPRQVWQTAHGKKYWPSFISKVYLFPARTGWSDRPRTNRGV